MRTRFLSLCLLSLLGQPAFAADWLYLTEPGDTLSQIGQTYLKNLRDWPKVQSANGVPIPEKLPANTRIRIPVELLKVTPAPVTVTAVAGNVRVKPGDGPFRPLAVGDQLTGGESVLTGPRSSAAYRFADGTVLTQQDSSKLGFGRLKSYGKTGMVSTELALDSGRLEAHAGKQLAPLGGFQVKTPVAVAGLRGTTFRLNVAEDGKSLRNEVLEGAVAVAAQGREVRVEAGQGTYAELGKPPAPPRPLLAAPGAADLPARVMTLPLEFSWPAVPGAKGYRAQLARDAAFAQVVLDDRTQEPHVKWTDDLPDGPYVLRLRAGDGDGLEGFNRDQAFELDARPFPPLLSAPALGERLYQNDVLLTWSAASGAQGYRVQLSPTPDFSRDVIERRLPAVLRLQETLPDGEWHWRAASLDEAGQPHLWSAHRAFRIQPLPGAPAGGQAKAGDGKAEFAWNEARGAARYGFEVAGGQDMARPLMSRETDKTATSAELKPGKYFWRARGVEADGQTGAWSEASPVIMPPPRPTDLSARVENGQIQATWKGEAPAYRLELARDPAFTQPVAKASVPEAKANLAKPEPGNYWLRVVALGADGVESPASTSAAIEVKQDVPWWLLILLVPFL
ncbi:MAG: FecR domain-containing protein [Pseudomonadota bacterium]